VDVNLKRHLSDHRLHYSRAIYRALDATQIAWLLSGHGIATHDGKQVPISQLVDPIPVRYVGNYLAFKMNSDAKNDPAWKGWLDQRGIHLGATRLDIIPLGTGGVFAEAVLGRSNSAERLDITRFWNWQDSPIPIQPTEISAIQTGSRATPEDVKPGQLSPPIVNITQPTTLPDPVGTAAVLAAIQNGNMFRDMSGLQATIGLAQAALEASATGASAAAQQAGTNMQNHLQAQTERMRIAADLVKSLASTIGGRGSTGALKAGTHSQDGAKINYFDKNRTTSGPASNNGSGGGSGGAGGLVIGGQSGGASASPAPAAPGYWSDEQRQWSDNPGIWAATYGDSQSPSQLFENVVDKTADASYFDDADGPELVAEAGSIWPYLNAYKVRSRLSQLSTNPWRFSQGPMYLCPMALFWYQSFLRDPTQAKDCGISLLENGSGTLGGLTVRSNRMLRSLHFDEYYEPDALQQADWMLMACLQDTVSHWISQEYNGTLEDKEKTTFAALTRLFEHTDLYTDVTSHLALGATLEEKLQHLQTLQPQKGVSLVSLWVNANFQNWPESDGRKKLNSYTHMISLEGPVRVESELIKLRYWTYGAQVKEHELHRDFFLTSFYGTITAEY
jgi:hypothetical protein